MEEREEAFRVDTGEPLPFLPYIAGIFQEQFVDNLIDPLSSTFVD
jgi:hypothetical protein